MAIKISWQLACDKTTAINILKEATDDVSHSIYFGKNNYKGNVSGESFRIWSQNPLMSGFPSAIGKGKFSQNGEKSILDANIDVAFPFRYMPSSSLFWSLFIPITIVAYFMTIFGIVFESYSYLSSYTFPLGAICVFITLFGFFKYMGASDLVFIERFLNNTYSKYIE